MLSKSFQVEDPGLVTTGSCSFKLKRHQCLQGSGGQFTLEGRTEAGMIESIVMESFQDDPASFDIQEHRVGGQTSHACIELQPCILQQQCIMPVTTTLLRTTTWPGPSPFAMFSQVREEVVLAKYLLLIAQNLNVLNGSSVLH